MYDNDYNHPSPNSNDNYKKGLPNFNDKNKKVIFSDDNFDIFLRMLRVKWESLYDLFLLDGRVDFRQFLMEVRSMPCRGGKKKGKK